MRLSRAATVRQSRTSSGIFCDAATWRCESECNESGRRSLGVRAFVTHIERDATAVSYLVMMFASTMKVECTLPVVRVSVAGTAVEHHGTRASFRSTNAARHLFDPGGEVEDLNDHTSGAAEDDDRAHGRSSCSEEGSRIMTASQILSLRPPHCHSALREGVRLGLIMATATWLWVALVDAVFGQPFHTFTALGGIAGFTVMHYLLNITYAVVVLSVIHSAERAPSLIFAVIFGVVMLEGAFAMVTNLIAQAAVGDVAWIGIFGGSLIATGVAMALLVRTHPLARYLHRAEEET
jgi:hypothetical protein